MNSSSFHSVNADGGLNFFKKILWIFFNLFNILFFPKSGYRKHIKKFCPDLTETDWKNVHKKSSPSRVISDLFWLKLDWRSIEGELKNINILDIGCGNGEYALKLNRFCNGRIQTYTGIDIERRSNWSELQKKHQFIKLKNHKAENIGNFIQEDTNLIITQSTIEHIDADLLFFSQLKDYIKKKEKNVIQIHLFPSSACIKTYPIHGVRQYTPRSVNKITKLYENFKSYDLLCELGGKYSNRLHFDYITKPLILTGIDLRETKTDDYWRLLRKSIINDIHTNSKKPVFYALIIHSFYEKKIFEKMDVLF